MKRNILILCILSLLCVLIFTACSAPAANDADVQAPLSDDAQAEQVASTKDNESGGYKDGTYTGVARGYKKGLHVDVTIQDGKIADVQIGDHNEDEPYLTDSLVIIPKLIETQDTNVDIVAGATKTCEGIGKAVDNALEQAK